MKTDHNSPSWKESKDQSKTRQTTVLLYHAMVLTRRSEGMITGRVSCKTKLSNWKIMSITVPYLIQGLRIVERRADFSATSCDKTTESCQACYFTDKSTRTQDYCFQVCKYPGRYHCTSSPWYRFLVLSLLLCGLENEHGKGRFSLLFIRFFCLL